MQRFNILFLGGSKRISLAKYFKDAAKELNLKTSIFSYELRGNHPFQEVGKVIIGMKWNSRNIYTHLLNIIKKKRINLVVPCTDQSVLLLPKLNILNGKNLCVTSSLEINKTFFNKIDANKYFENNKFGLIPSIKKNSYPKFIKPINGSSSINTHKISNKFEFNFFKKKYDLNKFIIQEFIDGQEYSVDAYVTQNNLIAGIVPRLRISTSGGESTVTKSVKNKSLLKIVKKIIIKSELKGPLTLQFIKRKNKYFFIEINTRLAGGVGCSINSNFNIPKIMIKDILNKKILPLKSFQETLTYKFYAETSSQKKYNN